MRSRAGPGPRAVGCRTVSYSVKGKVYNVAVRPAMLYGLDTVALTKRQEAEMEVAELKMWRFSLDVTGMDNIRNEYIRGTAQVGKFGEKTREARLRWYGHLRRKYDGYIGRRMLRMELPGKRKRKAKTEVYGSGERGHG